MSPVLTVPISGCVSSGVENLDSGVGVYAPDAEAYSLFSDLFDPIIEDYHAGFKKTDKHPNKVSDHGVEYQSCGCLFACNYKSNIYF